MSLATANWSVARDSIKRGSRTGKSEAFADDAAGRKSEGATDPDQRQKIENAEMHVRSRAAPAER